VSQGKRGIDRRSPGRPYQNRPDEGASASMERESFAVYLEMILGGLISAINHRFIKL